MAIHRLVVAPDGDQLAYLKGTPDALSLYVQPTDGDSPPRLLQADVRCIEPFMSLVWDGPHLYHARDDGNWFHDIWRVDTQSGEALQITDYFHTNSYPIAAHPQDNVLMVISNLRGELNVRLLEADTGLLRKITDYASPVKTAVYSPDGKQIAYTANATTNPHNTDVHIMSADGFDKNKLFSTLAGAFDIVRDWCPKGRYLAVESNFEGGWQAGVYDMRQLKLRWFTKAGGVASPLTFAPGGDKLLIRKQDDIQVFDVTTGLNKSIGAVASPGKQAAWLDASRVVFSTAAGTLGIYDNDDVTSLPG